MYIASFDIFEFENSSKSIWTIVRNVLQIYWLLVKKLLMFSI